MADSIRERCIKRIEEILATITLANGYALTVKTVQRFQQSGETTVDTPAILIMEGDEEAEQAPFGFLTKRLPIYLALALIQDPETDQRSGDEAMNEFRAEVQRALATDQSLNGQAIDLVPAGADLIDAQEGQPDLGSLLRYRLFYRHAYADPYALV